MHTFIQLGKLLLCMYVIYLVFVGFLITAPKPVVDVLTEPSSGPPPMVDSSPDHYCNGC